MNFMESFAKELVTFFWEKKKMVVLNYRKGSTIFMDLVTTQ